ncbi:MAG TPA: hypothetical protein VM597_33550, partial [Gemmataceae bacterium]|nr:hypothetical protein [Gemmataceae bacterium]
MSTGPSWKHSGGTGGQPSNRPAASRKSWQPGQTTVARKAGSPSGGYRMRVAAAGVSLTLLIGLIIFLIWMISPTPTPSLVLVAPAADDSSLAPPNAASGAGEFATAFADDKSEPKTAAPPDPKAKVADWFKDIDTKTKLPVVLYFAAPGAADKDGPFLWFVPADALVPGPEHKLRVTDILTHVEQNLDNRPPVLLIFDAATEPAAWARGQLHNDFARQLRDLDKRIAAIENLVVVCSADTDQRSWVAEEWRQTAFTHFLKEALRGVGFDRNARVTAQAVFDKAKKNTFEWAQRNRDAAQEPFLLPTADPDRAAQMVVTTLKGEEVKPTPPPTGGGYPDALKAAWREQARRAAKSPPPEATAPHLWREYLDLLLKADRAARATQGDLPAAVTARLAALQTDLGVPPWANPPSCLPYALPAATALWEPRPTITVEQFQPVLAAPNTAARLAAWTDLAGRVGDGDRMRPEIRLAGADALLQYLLSPQTRLDQETLEKAADVLRLIDGAAARPVETHLVHMFQKNLKDRNPDLVRQAIRVQIEAEKAAWFSGDAKYPHAEQVARWFGDALSRADERRRELTDLVFAGSTDAVPATGLSENQPVALLAALEANRKEYEDLGTQAAALAGAYRLRDTVLSRLPYYARWAAARRIPKEAAEPVLKQIEDLADKAHNLADVLEKPTPGETEAVLALAGRLRTGDSNQPGFERLEADFKGICEALSEKAAPGNWHALDAALEVPFIPPDTREAMIVKIRSISRNLESGGSATGAASTTVVPLDMAQRQGRMAVAVLGRRGFGARLGGKPKDDVASLIRDPDKAVWQKSLNEAGAEIGAAFADLPKEALAKVKDGAQRKPDTMAEDVRNGASLTRLIDGATRMPPKSINPVAEERRYWTHLLLIGQARRTAADGWADIKAGTGYSAQAAREYLNSADVILFSGSPVPESERQPWKKHFPSALPQPMFTFDVRPRFSVTNQADERLAYTVTPTGGATGFPLLKIHSITAPVTAEKLSPGPLDTYLPIGRFAGPQMNPQPGAVTVGV